MKRRNETPLCYVWSANLNTDMLGIRSRLGCTHCLYSTHCGHDVRCLPARTRASIRNNLAWGNWSLNRTSHGNEITRQMGSQCLQEVLVASPSPVHHSSRSFCTTPLSSNNKPYEFARNPVRFVGASRGRILSQTPTPC